MTTPRSSTPGHEPHGRPMPPPAGANAAPGDFDADEATQYGGSLFGTDAGGLEGVRKAAVRNERASEQHDGDHDRGDDRSDRGDVPIGSALHEAQGMRGAAGPRDSTVDVGGDLSSGPDTLGATTGGERAVTGRTDASRNSRNDHSQIGGGNLEG